MIYNEPISDDNNDNNNNKNRKYKKIRDYYTTTKGFQGLCMQL